MINKIVYRQAVKIVQSMTRNGWPTVATLNRAILEKTKIPRHQLDEFWQSSHELKTIKSNDEWIIADNIRMANLVHRQLPEMTHDDILHMKEMDEEYELSRQAYPFDIPNCI